MKPSDKISYFIKSLFILSTKHVDQVNHCKETLIQPGYFKETTTCWNKLKLNKASYINTKIDTRKLSIFISIFYYL